MLVNGIRQTTIPLTNRGLAYGDGLFETILIHQGRPVLLEQHLQRLQAGCRVLGLADPSADLLADIELLRPDLPADGILKIIVTRAEGGRGYRGILEAESERILSLHPRPDYGQQTEQGISAFISEVRLSRQPLLAGLKHLNRLEQVLASNHWPDNDLYEGLMLDQAGALVEGTKSNFFLVRDGNLCTPSLNDCGVAGILRNTLIEALPDVQVCRLGLEDLEQAEEAFFCNSVGGVWPLLGIPALHSAGQLSQDLSLKPGSFARAARDCFIRLLENN